MDRSSKGQTRSVFVNYSFETDQFQEIDVQKFLHDTKAGKSHSNNLTQI